MKKIYNNKILNIPGTDTSDNTFLFEYFTEPFGDIQDVEVIYMADLLQEKKNTDILEKVAQKPAMYSNVYAPVDELEIFTQLFDTALSEKKRIHIVGVTLKQEIEMLESYYHKSGYFDENINCYIPDFSQCLVSVSVNIENLMWRGSDYKRMGEAIFFCPPIRESGENKAMFKGINRGVIAGISMQNFGAAEQQFLTMCITDEKILPITLAKTLKYNLEDAGCAGDVGKFAVKF